MARAVVVGLSVLALMLVQQPRQSDAAAAAVAAVDGHELSADVAAPPFQSPLLDGRGKKNKNAGPVLAAGAAVMAGTLVPIAFGALFVLAGKAIMTSLVAITISGLLGLKALFGKHESSGHVKAYTAPSPHRPEAQSEHELDVYRGRAEADHEG